MVNLRSVIVSTDEPLVEIGVRTLLGQDPEFQLLGVVKSQEELLRASQLHRPSLIVFGLAMSNDLGAIREVLRAAPDSAVVLWAREVSTELAHQAVNAGVRGFVSTTASPERFKECLMMASRGELWMEQSLTMNLLSSRPVRLSKRQSDLIGLLVQGLKNKEIAATLGISEGTVKAYLTTLYEKVGARDRFELALFGLKNLGEHRGEAGGSRAGDFRAVEPLKSLVAPRPTQRRGDA